MGQLGLLKISIACLIFLFSCAEDKKPSGETPSGKPKNLLSKPVVNVPKFDSDSAYKYIEKQIAFGPRVPNTESHLNCAIFLENKLSEFADTVIVQKADLKAFNGDILKSRNIIASFNPEKLHRVLLCAHWDTRPFADMDTDKSKYNEPIDGANDGGSGVGVLLEIARQLKMEPTKVGIDIVLFDSEDYGQPQNSSYPNQSDTWCLGSQYWSKNPHVKGYTALYGILLDMVGAKNAKFYMEGVSMRYAPHIVQKVWSKASDLGYTDYFVYKPSGDITDDHYYVNEIANIPCIDIIQHDPLSMSYFGTYWHTHDDNMSVIDKNTLKAVGQTVMATIYSE